MNRESLASMLLKHRARKLSASPSCDERREKAVRKMKQLRLILMAAMIGLMASAGVFAQKGGNNNRPPKETPRIVDKDKEKPPPKNSNRGRPE